MTKKSLSLLYFLMFISMFYHCDKSGITKNNTKSTDIGTKSFQLAIACPDSIVDTLKNLRAKIKINQTDIFDCDIQKDSNEMIGDIHIDDGVDQLVMLELQDSSGQPIYSGDTTVTIDNNRNQNIGITLKHHKTNNKKIRSCIRKHHNPEESKAALAPFVIDQGTIFLCHMGPLIWIDGNDISIPLKDEVSEALGEIVGGNYKTSLFGVGISLDTNKGKSWVLFDDRDDLDIDSGSLEAVVYATGYNKYYNHIIDKSWLYGLTTYNGKLAAHFGRGWWYSSITLEEGWHYIAVTHYGTTLKLYLDGKAVDSTNTYQGLGDRSYPLGIGNASASSHDIPFHGIIDEIRISNCARTSQEIESIWNTVADRIY